LQAKLKICKGTFLFEYVGEIITNAELMQWRALQELGKSKVFMFALDANWKSKEVVTHDGAMCIDNIVRGNVSRF